MTDREREARIRERLGDYDRGVKGTYHEDDAEEIRFLLARVERYREALDPETLRLAADACEYMADEYQTRVEHAHASGEEERADYWEPKVFELRRAEENLRQVAHRTLNDGEDDG